MRSRCARVRDLPPSPPSFGTLGSPTGRRCSRHIHTYTYTSHGQGQASRVSAQSTCTCMHAKSTPSVAASCSSQGESRQGKVGQGRAVQSRARQGKAPIKSDGGSFLHLLITYSSRIAAPKSSKEPTPTFCQTSGPVPSHSMSPPPLRARRISAPSRSAAPSGSAACPPSLSRPRNLPPIASGSASTHSACVRMAGLEQLARRPMKSCMPKTANTWHRRAMERCEEARPARTNSSRGN